MFCIAVAWQLESYNNTHRNSKIYMDIIGPMSLRLERGKKRG